MRIASLTASYRFHEKWDYRMALCSSPVSLGKLLLMF